MTQSELSETGSDTFSPANLSDRTVTEESRRALQFLYNPKTRPGLEDIMCTIFEGL